MEESGKFKKMKVKEMKKYGNEEKKKERWGYLEGVMKMCMEGKDKRES